MISITVLCAFVGLLQTAASRSLLSRAIADDDVPVPQLKNDFKKGDVPAQWANGYPKKWGSEDFGIQFNDPEPDDTFGGVVTEDEKYVVMFNGSHIRFVDLDTKIDVSTFNLGNPPDSFLAGMTLRSKPQGGYDLLFSGGESRYATPNVMFRRRIASDLKPIGELESYLAGEIGDIDKNGRVASTGGYIYDLDTPDVANVTLKDHPSITGMSFSGDGQYLATVGWVDMSADLWNATTGERILQFPPTHAQNWLTKISPDNKYVIISLGTAKLQIYSLANLDAEPTVVNSFNDWIRSIEWTPNAKYLATGDRGRMQVWKFPEVELVQTWQINSTAKSYDLYEPWGLSWLDGENKVSWTYRYGRYMYDFESNLKRWWTPGYDDHSWGNGGVTYLKKRGYIATVDGDSRIRFWKI